MRTAQMEETFYGDITFNGALWGVAYRTATSICYQYVIHSHKGFEVALKISFEHKLWTKNTQDIFNTPVMSWKWIS